MVIRRIERRPSLYYCHKKNREGSSLSILFIRRIERRPSLYSCHKYQCQLQSSEIHRKNKPRTERVHIYLNSPPHGARVAGVLEFAGRMGMEKIQSFATIALGGGWVAPTAMANHIWGM